MAPVVMNVTIGSTSQPWHPCLLGKHRPAYLTTGGIACGYCGIRL